ncbi:MAG: HIT family protein [Alphaproteobacteria bacterium]|nr:HIT family protein [Alphaproteobacteria bacterium]
MNRDPGCIFCRIVAGEIPAFKLYEDSATLAFMDIAPLNPGHCLVISKAHAPDLYSSDPADLAATVATTQRVARAVKAALAPDGLNLLQANGKGAAQSVLHFHIHILPRRMGDEASLNWHPKPGDKAEIAAIADTIKRCLG